MHSGKASYEDASVRSSVIIVGAGPVGLSLALSLGYSGVDSIILEKNSGLQQYSRAILIPPRTLDIFDGWGLLERARQAGIFSPCLSVYDAESNSVAFTIDFSDLKDVSENAGFLFLPQTARKPSCSLRCNPTEGVRCASALRWKRFLKTKTA